VSRKTRARLDVVGRIGFAARALVYSMVGVLALQAALGKGHPKLDRKGAFEVIGAQPFGWLILMVLAAGFVGFAAWRWGLVVTAKEPLPWWKRVAYLASGAFHAGLALLALFYLAGTRGEDRWDSADLTALGLALPLGPYVVAAVGAALLGDAGWAGHRAVTLRFRRHLDENEMSDRTSDVATWAGMAGLAARGIVHALMGVFLLRAAWLRDPEEAVGWNDAMWLLHRVPWGGFALALLAAGLLARGAYDVIEARYRRRCG
jgi:hypothetical protein